MTKRNFLWSMAALLMTAALSSGFASCGDDDDDDNPLVGTWETEQSYSSLGDEGRFTDKLTLEFKSNGKWMNESVTTKDGIFDGKTRVSGTYKVEGNKVAFTTNQEEEVYDIKANKWNKVTIPDPILPVTYYFIIKGEQLFFYGESDPEMLHPRMVYKKK